MNKVIFICLFLSGCMTVPVSSKFPDAPKELKEKCPQLNLVNVDEKEMSEVLKTITKNYSLYHECSEKINSWIEWHDSQKKIFEQVK
jgi:hypothetical protein